MSFFELTRNIHGVSCCRLESPRSGTVRRCNTAIFCRILVSSDSMCIQQLRCVPGPNRPEFYSGRLDRACYCEAHSRPTFMNSQEQMTASSPPNSAEVSLETKGLNAIVSGIVG